MSILVKKVFVFVFLAITIILFSACSKDDNPVIPQEDHYEAIGMMFRTSGIEVAKILRGVTADTLKGPNGEIGDALEITFFDEEENEIDPPTEPVLSWEIDDPTIFEVWQHEGEEGGFEFHIKGLKAGVSNVEFFIMHEGHSDFRSGKIPVKIQ